MSKAPRDAKKSTNVNSPVSDAPAGSSQISAPRGPSVSVTTPSRIVGSQAKKQEEVTRQGTQKMKFIPTLPARRKQSDTEVKQEEAPAPSTPTKVTERDRGRGRGLGRGRGRGRGGQPPPRPEMQMTASGPFAMGPALAGSSKRRVPPSNFTPVMAMGSGSTSLGGGLSGSGPPVLRRERATANKGVVNADEEDLEVYSDPDEGVQIVDMDAIKTMDWLAPESLRRERGEGKGSKKKKKADAVKKEAKGKEKATDKTDDEAIESVAVEEAEKNLANALDLSDSEEEEEMEDLIEDFALEMQDMEEDDSLTHQEKLYFFQFPQPFPSFSLPDEATVSDSTVPKDHQPEIEGQKTNAFDKGKKVTFAQDVKPPAPNGSEGDQGKQDVVSVETVATAMNPGEEKKVDGIIGQLEVHRSGIIKMRLGNGMLMDVTAATQPSFLQHAVFLDPTAKKMHVLGEVNRRFVVSPDVDKLLEEMDIAEAATKVKSETSMDAT